MTVLSRLLGNNTPDAERRFRLGSERSHALVPFNTGTTLAGTAVTEEKALSFLPVLAAVNCLASDISTLPIDTYRKQGDSRIPLDTPSWLTTPNPEMDSCELISRMMVSLTLWGNAYTLVVRDDIGRVLELWPLDPALVQVKRGPDKRLMYVYNNKAQLTADEVMHVKALPHPRLPVGLSPIGAARTAIGAGIAADQFAAAFWGNGAVPAGILTFPTETEDDDIDRQLEVWKRAHQGSSKSFKTAALVAGVSYQQLSIPPEDAQFLETRKFSVTEIARLFRIPPSKLADLERSTFSNIEEQSIAYVTDSLRPWLTRIESALSRLLPNKQFVKFNEKALLRGDSKGEAEALSVAWDRGIISLNEWRATLDMEPLPADQGDLRFRPANFSPIGAQPEMTEAQRYDIAFRLVGLGFDPAESFAKVGLQAPAHSGHLPAQLQFTQQVEPDGTITPGVDDDYASEEAA